MTENDWLGRILQYWRDLDGVETLCRAIFLIVCVAIGTWLGAL